MRKFKKGEFIVKNNNKDIPMFGPGGFLPKPTASDSLAVMNAAIAVQKYYDNLTKKGWYKKPEVSRDKIDQYFNPKKLNEIQKESLLTYKRHFNNPADYIQYAVKNIYPKVTENDVKKKAEQSVLNIKNKKPNTYLYKDLLPLEVDEWAPSTLIDMRIKPQTITTYEVKNDSYTVPGGGYTRIMGYDPIAVKPDAIKTAADRVYMQKTYGVKPPARQTINTTQGQVTGTVRPNQIKGSQLVMMMNPVRSKENLKKLETVTRPLTIPKVVPQGELLPITPMQLPQQGNIPFYGPGNTIIGYTDDNRNFYPAQKYTGSPNNQLNLQDKQLLENPELLQQYVLKKDNYKFAKGGVTVNSGGEKHRIYVKTTERGEGTKGHIMVNHPTIDKGMWDTIDLTEKAGAKTIAQGVAATKKWHKENPYKKQKGGSVNLNLPVFRMPEKKPFVFNKFLVNDRNQNLFIGGINPTYQNEKLSVGPYMVGVGNKYFQKFPADYGVRGNYNVNDNFNINMSVGKNNINAGVNYKFLNGGKFLPMYGPGGNKKQSFRDQLLEKNGPVIDETATPILVPLELNYNKPKVVNSPSAGLNKTQLKNVNQNLKNRAEQEKKQKLEEYRAAKLFHENNPVAKVLGTRQSKPTLVKPTSRELAYGLGAGINDFYDVPGIGIGNDFVNPLSLVSKGIISPWAQAPLQAQQSDSYLPYAGAAVSTVLTAPMLRPALVPTKTILNPRNIYTGALEAGQLSKKGLREGVDLFHPVGRKLKQIEKEGIAKGLSLQEIKKLQLDKVGITSLQREGYFPGVSEIVTEYITPYSYDNAKKRILDIPRRIIKGEKNSKRLSDVDINFIFDYEKKNLVSKPRYDAFRLYAGLPQKNNSFRIAETTPINHPSYSAKQLDNLEKFSLNQDERLLSSLPHPMDNAHLFYAEKEDLIKAVPLLEEELNKIQYIKNKGIDNTYDFNTTNVMGGYNRRFFDNKMEYNDIWDLDLNGLKVDKYFGKPFLSHGQLNYSFEPAEKEINRLIKDGKFYKESYNDINTKIKKPKYLHDIDNYIDDFFQKLKQPVTYQPLKQQNVIIKKKKQEGGLFKESIGEWDYPRQSNIMSSKRK